MATSTARIEDKLHLRDLELLVAIDDHRSVSGAAQALGLAQPSASRKLMDIEQALSVHLFERERSKGMSATPAGTLVLARARAMLADCRSMAMEIDALRAGVGGHLRLGVIPFAPSSLVASLINTLVGPEQRMSVAVTEGSTTQLMRELNLQALDAIIARCSATDLSPGLAQETLFQQTACLLAHAQSALVRKERIQMADLAGYSWLLPARGTPTRMFINEAFSKARLSSPVPVIEAGSNRIIHLVLRANRTMLAIVPSDVGQDIEHLGGVRALPLPIALKMPVIGLIYASRHRDTPLLGTLRTKVRGLLNQPAR